MADGPLVAVTFAPHPVDEERLKAEGTRWEPAQHRMMVDTGAELTVVEQVVPTYLGLSPIRTQHIQGVGGVVDDCPVYRLRVLIGVRDHVGNLGAMAFTKDVVAVSSPPSLERKHVGFLGRDFLQHVRLVYDGPNATFELVDLRAPSLGPAGPPPRSASAARAAKSKRKSAKEARKRGRR